MYSGINRHWHPYGTKNDASLLPKEGLVLATGWPSCVHGGLASVGSTAGKRARGRVFGGWEVLSATVVAPYTTRMNKR